MPTLIRFLLICKNRECATIRTQLKNREITHAEIKRCGFNAKTMLICCPQPSIDNSTDENFSESYDQLSTTDDPITMRKYEQFCESISQHSGASADIEGIPYFVSSEFHD